MLGGNECLKFRIQACEGRTRTTPLVIFRPGAFPHSLLQVTSLSWVDIASAVGKDDQPHVSRGEKCRGTRQDAAAHHESPQLSNGQAWSLNQAILCTCLFKICQCFITGERINLCPQRMKSGLIIYLQRACESKICKLGPICLPCAFLLQIALNGRGELAERGGRGRNMALKLTEIQSSRMLRPWRIGSRGARGPTASRTAR